tara:strand:+ start:1643 stop:2434 length:792 start_codon:yes stop_codon:yes gene_type:complete
MEEHFKGTALLPFVTRANDAPDASSINDILLAAVRDPAVYVFGELLEVPKVKEVGTTPAVQLVNIFAHGTHKDLSSNQELSNLLQSEAAERKLKQLSIITLSQAHKVLPYRVLLEELSLDHVRELEDLVIDALYRGVFVGKLDQRREQFVIDETIGRDIVTSEELSNTLEVLQQWRARTRAMMQSLGEQMNSAQTMYHADKEHIKSMQNVEKDRQTAIALEMQQELVTELSLGGEGRAGQKGAKRAKIRGKKKYDGEPSMMEM